MLTYCDIYRLQKPHDLFSHAVLPLLGLAVLVVSTLMWPARFAILAALLLLFFAVYIRPMSGLYLFSLFYGLGSCSILLNVGWPMPIKVYAFEILNLILSLVMIARYLGNYHGDHEGGFRKIDKSYGWLLYLGALFVFWSALTLTWTSHIGRDLNAWYKLNSQFIAIFFIVTTLNSYDKLLKFLKFHFFVTCVLYGAAAEYASYDVSPIELEVYRGSKAAMDLQFYLYNQTGGYKTALIGIFNGYGFCSKHEVSMLLFSGVLIGLFLLFHYRSLLARSVVASLMLFFETLIFVGFDRLIIAGSLIILSFFCVMVQPWRRWAIILFIVFFCFNVAGYGLSQLLITENVASNDPASKKYSRTTSKSEYQAGSLSFRIRQWRTTLSRIQSTYGLGLGPGALAHDNSVLAHGHNLILTLSAEYGVPSALIVLGMMALVARSAYYKIFWKPKVGNDLWRIRAMLTATVLSALIAYSFDVLIYWPQLWYAAGLLLASLTLVQASGERPGSSNKNFGLEEFA